jgi:hypothetical protein
MVLNKPENNTPSRLNGSGSTQSAQNGGSYSEWNKKGSVIPKPQKLFKDKIDNSLVPFLPKIREKPNALVSLSGKFKKLHWKYLKNEIKNFILFAGIFSLLDDNSVEVTQQLFEENLELYVLI